MLLLVGYVASTRYYRREMDVTTFMATIRRIATVRAVRPNVERELLELGTGQRRERCAGRFSSKSSATAPTAPAVGPPRPLPAQRLHRLARPPARAARPRMARPQRQPGIGNDLAFGYSGGFFAWLVGIAIAVFVWVFWIAVTEVYVVSGSRSTKRGSSGDGDGSRPRVPDGPRDARRASRTI